MDKPKRCEHTYRVNARLFVRISSYGWSVLFQAEGGYGLSPLFASERSGVLHYELVGGDAHVERVGLGPPHAKLCALFFRTIVRQHLEYRFIHILFFKKKKKTPCKHQKCPLQV
jgi:hypothetical protein